MRSICLSLTMVVLVVAAACSKDTPTAPTPTTGSAIGLSGSLAFGNVTVGTTATAALTITNTGLVELAVTSIGYPAGFSGNWAAGSIAAAASQIVSVTFAPTAGSAYTGTITVDANQASGTNTIAVSGTGTVSPAFTLAGLVTESAPTTSTVSAGVTVTFVDGVNQGKSATTGADGRYQITGVSNGGYTVRATLAGYVSAALPVGVDGNTTMNIRLDPVGPRTSFGPGQYRVNIDIPAGLYYSDPGHGCRFQRLRGFGGTSSDVITITQVNFDAGFETESSCGSWFTTPGRGLQTVIAAGSWVVGTQVTPGTYRAENSGLGCEWQRLSNFTGSFDAVIASGFANGAGSQLVTIAPTDAGFSTTADCGSWLRTSAATAGVPSK